MGRLRRQAAAGRTPTGINPTALPTMTMRATPMPTDSASAPQGPRVMAVGGNFLGKGAEAMLLTVRDAVVERFPDAVVCAPSSPGRSRDRYHQHGIVPVVTPDRTCGMRRVDRWLTLSGLLRQRPVDPVRLFERDGKIINIYRCSDAVVDVSGFVGSDEFGPRASLDRLREYELAAATGNRIILMPQSWGPLRNPAVRQYVGSLVRMADLVFARERDSLEYLMDLPGIDRDRIHLSPDIAFQFHGAPVVAGRELLRDYGIAGADRLLIGITPNMRIVERTPGRGQENSYFRSLVAISRWFLANTDATLVLIPHESSPGRANDPELSAMVADALGEPRRVVALGAGHSAAEVKAVIASLEFLVASRYHSLVAALSCRTPVGVIGWSHKYDDLMNAAGLADWVSDPARRADADPQAAMVHAWQSRDQIRAALVANVPRLEAGSRRAIDLMLDALVHP